MPISPDAKEDLLLTVDIELQRMFSVLTNCYDGHEYRDHAVLLPQIETTLKKSLGTIRKDASDPNNHD